MEYHPEPNETTTATQAHETETTPKHRKKTQALPKLRIGAFNAKGLRNAMEETLTIFEKLDILFISETWIRECDKDMPKMVDEQVRNPSHEGKKRGFGGVAMMINPMIKYVVISKFATKNIQALTVRVHGVTITGLYIAPNAKAEEEAEALNTVQKISRGAALIIGDLNARSRDWDTKSNGRGRRLLKWARAHNWTPRAPKGHTFAIRGKGVSTIDITVMKGLSSYNVTVPPVGTFKSSDHQPITACITIPCKQIKERGKILKSMRSNPTILRKASEAFKSLIPTLIKEVKTCKSRDELEQKYNEVCEGLLKPWDEARKKIPNRYGKGWGWTLDQRSRLRQKYYRRAKVKNDEKAWHAYKKLDEEIKAEVKRNRQRTKMARAERLRKARPHEVAEYTRKLFKECNGTQQRDTGSDLNLASFTAHMATDEGHSASVEQLSFTTDEAFEQLVTKAIRNAKEKKASGPDELFTEAFMCSPQAIASLLTTIWSKCNELNTVISQWRTATLVPIFKKGPKDDPKSYRPISLLSHARKMIELAIKDMINGTYKNREEQLGFQKMAGTEIAVLRHIANGEALKFTAVLDLKGAYDMVPRDTLMKEVKQRLPLNTAAMITAMLSPLTVMTAGDNTQSTATISRGVPQGSSLSPCLFNLFMDKYIEGLKEEMGREEQTDGKWEATLFADDVKLMAQDSQILQRLLRVSGEWAKRTDMVWSTSKCCVLTNDMTTSTQLVLAGDILKTTTKATYLGFKITNETVLAEESTSRVGKARGKLHLLKTAGLHAATMESGKLLQICESFILSTATYGIHLTPQDAALDEKWEQLEKNIIILAMGCYTETRRARLRDIAKLLSLQETKGLGWNGMRRRLEKRAQHQGANSKAGQDVGHIELANKKLGEPRRWSSKDIETRRAEDDCRRQRKLPKGNKRKNLPCMYIKDLQTKTSAFRWYCGLYPRVRTRSETWSDREKEAMKDLKRVMPKDRWTKSDAETASSALREVRSLGNNREETQS